MDIKVDATYTLTDMSRDEAESIQLWFTSYCRMMDHPGQDADRDAAYRKGISDLFARINADPNWGAMKQQGFAVIVEGHHDALLRELIENAQHSSD